MSTVDFSDVITYQSPSFEKVEDTPTDWEKFWMGTLVPAMDHVSRMYDIPPGERDGVVVDSACDVVQALMNDENPASIVWSDFAGEEYRGVRNRMRQWFRQEYHSVGESQLGEDVGIETIADAMMAAVHETQSGTDYNYAELELLACDVMYEALQEGDIDKWNEVNSAWELVAAHMFGEELDQPAMEYRELEYANPVTDRIRQAYDDPKLAEQAAYASAVMPGYTDEALEMMQQQMRMAGYLAEEHVAIPPHSEPDYEYDDNEVECLVGYLRDKGAAWFVYHAISERPNTADASMLRIAQLCQGLSPTEKAGVVLGFAGEVARLAPEGEEGQYFGLVRSMLVSALSTDEEIDECVDPEVLNDWSVAVMYLFKESIHVASMVYNAVMGNCKHGIPAVYCSACRMTTVTHNEFSLDDENVFNRLFPSGSLGGRYEAILPEGSEIHVAQLVDALVDGDVLEASSPDWKPWLMEEHVKVMVEMGLKTRYSHRVIRDIATKEAKKSPAWKKNWHTFFSNNEELAPLHVRDLRPNGLGDLRGRLVEWADLLTGDGELRIFLNFDDGKKRSLVDAIKKHLSENELAMKVAVALGG